MDELKPIEVGELVYGIGAHGGQSEACYLARTRAHRKKMLRPRGLVFDETSYMMNNPVGVFFCLENGHHFKGNIERWTNNGRRCPFCTGEMTCADMEHAPHVDKDEAERHRLRYTKMHISTDEIQKRMKIYQCKVHDISKFTKIKDPIDIECLICGDVWNDPYGVERVFAALYSLRNRCGGEKNPEKTPKGFEPAPYCKKCRKDVLIPHRAQGPVRNRKGILIDLGEVNRRLKKWNMECLHLGTSISDKDNKWKCNTCGHEWIGDGQNFCYMDGRRKATPCKKCYKGKPRKNKWTEHFSHGKRMSK